MLDWAEICKIEVFTALLVVGEPVSLRKEKPRKSLEEYGGYRKKTFLCPTTGTPPVPPYFGAVAAAR